MKLHHWLTLILAVLLVGGFLLWPRFQNNDVSVDELTGTWRAEGVNEDEYPWWMEYEFQDTRYTLTTDSSYKEEGTYAITERFLDGSLLVKKIYKDGSKEYNMTVVTTDDPNMITIDGAVLNRVSE
ncbi:hypothetical protein HY631_01550 [Candidatus Uhrbacteria bacterium]|nr:hypothetical protein [Candidatus Uhrbacteria bacterium]